MTDTHPRDSHPNVDPERTPKSAFDGNDSYSGQNYTRERERAEYEQTSEERVRSASSEETEWHRDGDGAVHPTEAGKHASFDRNTGEVHGSGSGAGGGNPGEDHVTESAGGGGYPVDGAEGRGPGPRH